MSSITLEKKKLKGYSVSSLINEKGEHKILVMKFNKGKKPDVEVISCVDRASATLEYDMVVSGIEIGTYKLGNHNKITM